MSRGVRASSFHDKTGLRYGRLTVVSLHGFRVSNRNKKQSLWLCKCDCGKISHVLSQSLTSGATTSCGCVAKERLKIYVETLLTLPKGVASFNALYARYRHAAIRRNLMFSITKEAFKTLCENVCFYCGKNPSAIQTCGGHTNGVFIYNGVDRVNNEEGYIDGNCVSCCKICNFMKKAMSKGAFLAHIESIHYNTPEKKTNEQA